MLRRRAPRPVASAHPAVAADGAEGVGTSYVADAEATSYGADAEATSYAADATEASSRSAGAPGPTVPLRAALCAVALTALLTYDVAHHGPLSTIDLRVSGRMLAWGLRFDRWPRRVLTPGLWFGQRGTVLTGSALLAALAAWRIRTIEPFLRLVVAVVALAVVVYAFKLGLSRNAPVGVARGEPSGTGTSYPSGHTANAVLLWGLADYTARRAALPERVVRLIRAGRWAAPWIVSVVMILLDYHWLTDLAAGMAMGVVLLQLTLWPVWSALSAGLDRRLFKGAQAPRCRQLPDTR